LSETTSKNSIRILLIDDEEILLHIIGRIISRAGFEVFRSNTAVDVLTTVGKYSPDLILMDDIMPSVAGVEATKRIKASERHQSIPVIFLSLSSRIAELAYDAGADAYVVKTDAFVHLIPVILDVLNRESPADRI
jgi:CheY-like chemotaxis protein